jgi:RNA polymerase sigma-70 factor, ECF subfamily
VDAAAEADTEELLNRAAAGDAAATTALLGRHRSRLKHMIAVRTDKRFASRFDDSDVVQDTLAAAAAQLPEYLASSVMPFYPWLRRIAQRKLVEVCRYHQRGRRSVGREDTLDAIGTKLPDHSAMDLARRLIAPGKSPSQLIANGEVRQRVQAALETLGDHDREVLVLYHLEQLTTAETAAVLGLSEDVVKARRRRAILRLGALVKSLQDDFTG